MIIWNRVLVGVDETWHSLQAVRYLAAVLGGSDNCAVRLLAVFVEPNSDGFQDCNIWKMAVRSKRWGLERRLAQASELLTNTGIPPANVSTAMAEAHGRTVAQTIIEVQQAGSFGTLVVGRRGISKTEEFLFGSVSNQVMHLAEGCSVWVVP